MSSIARRSIRTTAAAAGIAALGLGFAGPALAAPSVPELPTLDTTSAPALDTAVPGTQAFTQAAETAQTDMPALPDAFAFQAPSGGAAAIDPSYMSTFDPTSYMGSLHSASLPTEMNAAAMPSAPSMTALPSTDGLATLNGTFNGASVDNGSPALPSLDTANAFTGLASQAGVPSI
jgi:hypothetical protein